MDDRRVDTAQGDHRPVYVVWELTLACDQRCTHCGSRAAEARPRELSTAEALEVVAQLRAMRTEHVALIGGEAYLHPGFLEIARALTDAGIRASVTTGGRGVTPELCRQMAAAGIHTVSVSVDGLRETHDLMRATKGSFDAATAALLAVGEAGMVVAANTNLNRLNRGDLEALYGHLRGCGAKLWQVQLTAPLSRAADRPELTLQPWDLLELMPRITALKARGFREGLTLMPGNNLGYFAQDEALLRSQTAAATDHWRGCQAGRYVMGIESDGAVKGCPSLQTARYVGGSLRDRQLSEIWATPQLAFARARTVEDLWGFCRGCDFAEHCLGGCTFTAESILGRPGNNPYCAFRARHFAQRGLRERLVPQARAEGRPFDNGCFALVEEPLDADDPQPETARALVRPFAPARL